MTIVHEYYLVMTFFNAFADKGLHFQPFPLRRVINQLQAEMFIIVLQPSPPGAASLYPTRPLAHLECHGEKGRRKKLNGAMCRDGDSATCNLRSSPTELALAARLGFDSSLF